MKYIANLIGPIRSRIGLKIGVLVVIQIACVISSFGILSYYESQETHLGNSINIAGKNRFLTSNLMLELSEFYSNSSSVPEISSAMNQLESNILALRQGGIVSSIDLSPLPSKFLEDWNTIYQAWVRVKGILTNSIIQPNEGTNMASAITLPTIGALQATIESSTLSLLRASDVLVTKLGEYARASSQNSTLLQGIFAILNIAVAIVVLYLVLRILKPIFSLTAATSEIGKGNLDISVEGKGNDELSTLSNSFNSMVKSLKGYMIRQDELTKELERANEELKHRDRLKDEFINVAAHELRTPIQPILGLTEYLHFIKVGTNGTNVSMAAGQEELLLDVILRNSKRLMQLTEDILDVTKIESGSLLLKKEKFDLNEMILELLNEYRQRIGSNRDNVSLYYEGNRHDTIIIDGDRNRLCQVFNNLLSNAFKFTTRGSIGVIVERQVSDNSIIVRVKDTGAGIHPDILPKLFTKFVTKSDNGGTGLGLFISKSIIEKHGGNIWVEDNKGGKSMGAVFSFRLPANNTS
ncbi:MAG TPA: HAMP domain-containing sensor histidine kinase [Nitrososphaeraceae archaeon]|nr:HAMP domain-containing sensor histidine kinase [Nitrososphaeraceae archaeon]